MTDFFYKHKKSCIIAGITAAVIIFAVYLYALFFPGYWYGDVFLYKKSEKIFGQTEVYSGRDAVNKADYALYKVKEGNKTKLSFYVNDLERKYEIVSDNSEGYNPKVTIHEDGELVFKGTHGGFSLLTEDGEFFEDPITFSVSGSDKIPEEELFPSYNWIYDVSQQRTAIRGNPLFLIGIVLFAAVMIVDIAYPDFFWNLDHWIDTKGGEPSEFYRFTQKLLWILTPIIIIASMIFSFIDVP